MLRRAFLGMLAALPFVKKAGPLHLSSVNKPEDWSSAGDAGWVSSVKYRGYPMTLAELQAMHRYVTYGASRRHHAILTNIKVD